MMVIADRQEQETELDRPPLWEWQFVVPMCRADNPSEANGAAGVIVRSIGGDIGAAVEAADDEIAAFEKMEEDNIWATDNGQVYVAFPFSGFEPEDIVSIACQDCEEVDILRGKEGAPGEETVSDFLKRARAMCLCLRGA